MRIFFTFLITLTFTKANETWLFLGDSITHHGHYTDLVESALLASEGAPEMINLGLSSETVSGLSEPSHPFPRPYLMSRYDKVLTKVKPSRIFACYGMNCGIYHPFSEDRLQAYQTGIKTVIEKAHKINAEVTLITPPPFAYLVHPKPLVKTQPFGYVNVSPDYNQVLAKYAQWILSLDALESVTVIDWRPALEAQLEASYPVEPIHPNNIGHAIMAQEVLKALGSTFDLSNKPAHFQGLLSLVKQQRTHYDASLLNHLGHGNPGVMKRHTSKIEDAEQVNDRLKAEIIAYIAKHFPQQ